MKRPAAVPGWFRLLPEADAAGPACFIPLPYSVKLV